MIKCISTKTQNLYEKNGLAIIYNNIREVILVSNVEGTKLYASYILYEGSHHYSNGILDRSEAISLVSHKDLDTLMSLILSKLAA